MTTDAPDASLVEDVRLAIYTSLAEGGRLPPNDHLLGITETPGRLASAIATLVANRHLVLDDGGEIVMAHPFATRSFGFAVMSSTTLWWGGCSWDSFAIAHLVTTVDDVLVATRCPACDRPLAWVVDRREPPAGDEIAHFLVPASRIWDDVVHACAHQQLFCGHHCIDRYLADTNLAEGYRLDLPTLWRLASDWYTGRLTRGYQRREPALAGDYLRSVGLTGPFWAT